MKIRLIKYVFLLFLCAPGHGFTAVAQRAYKPNSVLATGNWYKIGVKEAGIYKIDIAFLNNLGINTSGLSSASVRLFGNGGLMLAESNTAIPVDDLLENAIMMADGGDGVLNGADYFLFYAGGPHQWQKDSVNRRFIHQKNIYSDTAYYFLNIGGTGKRIINQQSASTPSISINSFNERYFYEADLVNLLSSGKEWLGEEFANAPGKTLTRNFSVSWPGLQSNEPLTLIVDCAARSVNAASRFDVRLDNQPALQINIPSVHAGIYDLFASQARRQLSSLVSQQTISVNFTYVPGAFNAQGWLNWFEIHGRRNLSLNDSAQLLFRDWNSVGNNTGEFIVSNATAATQVWDVTNPAEPVNITGNFAAGQFRFLNDCSRLKEYVAFDPATALVPASSGRVANQDLHSSQPADYIIISHPSLLTQAERLAGFHRQQSNLGVFVTTGEKIFNEFSSGNADPTALKNFVKMYYDKAAMNPADKPKYLLLFGDASFDYKNRISNNTNLVPGYQSETSFDPLNTYTSDDFFGFLDDQEDINSGLVTNLLDIGIGRVPAKNEEEAKNYVDKVLTYYKAESFGSWRNQLTFIADDEDNNLHLQDAESLTALSTSVNPVFNMIKIYLDAYRQQSGSSGSRYPQANEAIASRVFNGTLILNYSGHGGATRLAEEVILDQEAVNTWNNSFRLPLVVTATCDFAPYDNPFINSLGENLLLRPKNGAIGLMTTTRLVSSSSNRVMNNNYIQAALQPDAGNNYKSLGAAVMTAKNFTYQASGDIVNNRKFTLLGDPALTLGFPTFKIRTTSVNGLNVLMQTDTLSAGEKTVIEGEIIDNNGAVLNGFNGTIYPVVYDKPETLNTLANDPGSQVASFLSQTNFLFKGKATVTNGTFRFEFKVPKDINNRYDNGKISYYAENGKKDGSDFFNGFIIGGSSSVIDTDREGPVIKAWLNDEKFVNGGICNESPVLLLKFFDSSGINTSGAAIGHDISIIIDNDNNRFFVLNNYYEADLDNYRQGSIRFRLPVFEPGFHSIKIKAWDVLNNSAEITLDFLVVNDEELVINHVLNYPNPFTTKTQFWFEHNKPGQQLNVQIHIYSLTGRVIKAIERTINTPGNRSTELEWDARDEYGDRVGRGVYFYRIKIQCPGMKPRSLIEKLVVL